MNQQSNNTSVTYTHFGFFGIVPCWLASDGEHGEHVKPLFAWLEPAVLGQALLFHLLDSAIAAFRPNHQPSFPVLRVFRLKQ